MVGIASLLLVAAAANPRASKPRYEPQVIDNPGTRDTLNPGDKCSAALRAQILLSRAHFSVGEIDGSMGANTLEALAGFEEARGLPANNFIDDAIWQALNADQGPVLGTY